MLFYGIICHVRGFGNPVNTRKMRKTRDDKDTVRMPRHYTIKSLIFLIYQGLVQSKTWF